MSGAPPARTAPAARTLESAAAQRSHGLKAIRQWHWISSAVCLLGMLLFSVTGITLNHASQIEAHPEVVTRVDRLPAELKAQLAPPTDLGDPNSGSNPKVGAQGSAALPAALQRWIAARFGIDAGLRDAEWTAEEIYLPLPRPGGDAWLRIDRASGAVEFESTDRGWISYFNDLHKGRNSGAAWSAFIDVFALACLVFSVTGLLMLKTHARQRPSTWPLVAAGVVVPLLLALLFIH